MTYIDNAINLIPHCHELYLVSRDLSTDLDFADPPSLWANNPAVTLRYALLFEAPYSAAINNTMQMVPILTDILKRGNMVQPMFICATRGLPGNFI